MTMMNVNKFLSNCVFRAFFKIKYTDRKIIEQNVSGSELVIS